MINDPQLNTILDVVCILLVLLIIGLTTSSLLDNYKEYRRLKGILEMLTKELEEHERK